MAWCALEAVLLLNAHPVHHPGERQKAHERVEKGEDHEVAAEEAEGENRHGVGQALRQSSVPWAAPWLAMKSGRA